MARHARSPNKVSSRRKLRRQTSDARVQQLVACFLGATFSSHWHAFALPGMSEPVPCVHKPSPDSRRPNFRFCRSLQISARLRRLRRRFLLCLDHHGRLVHRQQGLDSLDGDASVVGNLQKTWVSQTGVGPKPSLFLNGLELQIWV